MPSLRKRPGSPYFVACFTLPDGRATQRTTKQTDRAKAMMVCLDMAQAAKLARQGYLTEVQARKVLGDILAATGETLHSQSVREYLTLWVNGKDLSQSPGTARRYRHTIDSFLAHLEHRADRPLSSLAPKDIELFRNDQIAQGKSAATVNLVVKTLRIPLNLARRQGLILTNPAEGTELLPMSSKTRDVFTMEQLQALITASDKEWKGMILIAAFAGLRLGDISKLTVSNLDLERRTLHFSPQKDKRSKQRRVLEIPLHPEVESYLLDLAIDTDHPNAPVFPTLNKKKISGDYGLSLTFRKIMKKAGIEAEVLTDETTGKGRKFYNLSFHSLRHTFVSALANHGVHPEVRMKLSGHSSNVHQRYTHHELETLRKNVETLPKLSQ